MKKHLLLFCLLIVLFVHAQDKPKLSDKLFKINLLSPGASYEMKVSRNTSFNLDGNFSVGGANREGFFPVPFIRGQYRMHYNLGKRVKKGRSILGNSGNYLAIHSSYYLSAIGNPDFVSVYDGFMLGGVWGFQKTYKNNLNLGSNLGLAHQFGSDKLLPVINFTIGYVLLK